MRKTRVLVDSIAVAVIAAVSALLSRAAGDLVAWFRNRRKDEAETDNTIVDSATDLVAILQEQQRLDHEHIQRLDKIIERQAVTIAGLRSRIVRMEAAFYKMGQEPPNGHDDSDPDLTAVSWGDYPPIDAVFSEKPPEA